MLRSDTRTMMYTRGRRLKERNKERDITSIITEMFTKVTGRRTCARAKAN